MLSLETCEAMRRRAHRYLSHAVAMLESAAVHSLQTKPEDEEEAEYNNALRNGILEAYAGILQGLKDDKTKLALLTPYAPRVLAFIEARLRACTCFLLRSPLRPFCPLSARCRLCAGAARPERACWLGRPAGPRRR